MSFVRPTLTEIVDRIQADLTTRLTLNGAVLRRSVVNVLARVNGAAAHLLHGHLEFLSGQLFPDTSTVGYLERQAGLYGLSRIAATYATGTATATGTNGTVIPAGTVLQRADGAQYTVNADVTIAGGTATLALTAVLAGVAGNAAVATVATFVSPIAGITATATVATAIAAGADVETDDALRTRLLARMKQAPHGGNALDYVTWALEVAGVTRAWAYPLELGAGTVTVRFVRDNDGSGSAIIPSGGEVTDVQAYVDARRPVTAAVTVVAPIADTLNFTIHIVPDTADTRAAVTAELTDLLTRSAKPGGTILLSQIRTAVGVAAGVTDFTVTAPAADDTHATGHIAIMGTVTWT